MNTKPTEFKLLKGAAVYGAFNHTVNRLTKPTKSRSKTKPPKTLYEWATTIAAFIILGLLVSR